jgi:hypothetical protein
MKSLGRTATRIPGSPLNRLWDGEKLDARGFLRTRQASLGHAKFTNTDSKARRSAGQAVSPDGLNQDHLVQRRRPDRAVFGGAHRAASDCGACRAIQLHCSLSPTARSSGLRSTRRDRAPAPLPVCLVVFDKRDALALSSIPSPSRDPPLLSKQPESDLHAFGNSLMFQFPSTESRSSCGALTGCPRSGRRATSSSDR